MKYTHKINGLFTLNFDNSALNLSIKDPVFLISGYYNSLITSTINIDVLFKDDNMKEYSRSYSFTSINNFDYNDCLSALLELPEFQNTNTI